jgi:hypothetical protein
MATGAVNDWIVCFCWFCCLAAVHHAVLLQLLSFCCQVPLTLKGGCSSLTWLVGHSNAVEPASGCGLGVARQLAAGCLELFLFEKAVCCGDDLCMSRTIRNWCWWEGSLQAAVHVCVCVCVCV